MGSIWNTNCLILRSDKRKWTYSARCLQLVSFVERSGSGVELRTLDKEKPSSNPLLRC